MQISGADLNKDGPVTITLDRALDHLQRDALSGIRSYVTYVIDPSPRSHNVLTGEIKNGVLSIKPAYIYLVGDMPFYPQIDLKNAHMRIHSEQGGKLVGYWGGLIDWKRHAYMFTARPATGDGIGFYQALKKMADAKGRNFKDLTITVFGAPPEAAVLAEKKGFHWRFGLFGGRN